jgi:hypothetical protein
MKTLGAFILCASLFSGCYKKSYGPKGSISQNGTGGFWKLESCKVKGRSVNIGQFPEKVLLETERRVVDGADGAPNHLFTDGMEYHVFKFYNKAVVRQDSFPAVLYDFDYSQREQRDSQWFKLTDDAGLMVILDVEREIGLTSKIQISNVMSSSSYKTELDTVHFTYIPIENFK